MNLTRIFSLMVVFSLLSACTSGQIKENRKKRDDVVAKTGVFCDFIKSDAAEEADVSLNLRMGDKCNLTKPFSLTNYISAQEQKGILYCCNINEQKPVNTTSNPQAIIEKDKKEETPAVSEKK